MDSITSNLWPLLQVIMIDLVLAGDNAIVVGLAASRVPVHMRRRVIFWGIAGAVVLRIIFAALTTQLLQIVGLLLAGGILLLWVSWKMYRELHRTMPSSHALGAASADTKQTDEAAMMGFWAALTQIIIADVSMSLDNVLAVAGAAKGNTTILVIGLVVAIVLMAVAATYIAQLLAKYPWISWIGLVIILYVALDMIWTGGREVACVFVPADVCKQGLIKSLSTLAGIS